MRKGFTLIELLVVIILIAAIVLLVLPNITNSVKNYNTNVDKTTLNIIKEATKLYVSDNENSFIKRSENTYCVSLNTLIEEDYLKNRVEYNNRNITNTKVVKVTYDNGFKYELVNEDECEKIVKFDTVCEADSEQLYASNTLDIGYKYNCKVDPDKPRYSFFVLSYNDENGNIIFDKENVKSVNLIMDRNICEDGTPTDEGKECYVAYNLSGVSMPGPATSMTYLNNATRSWENIDNLNITYDDEGANFTGFVLKEKARLPYKSEVGDVNNNNGYLYENLDSAFWEADESSRPSNNMNSIYGYWTLSTLAGVSSSASYVHFGGYVGTRSIDNDIVVGVRAVINLKI